MLRDSCRGLAFLCLSTTILFCNNGDSSSIPSQAGKISENLGAQGTPGALNDRDETVSAFVINKKGRLVAGTSAGILLSDDKGQSWLPVPAF